MALAPSAWTWPVLVADLADATARASLAELARDEGWVHLPLISAPGSASTHLLEVYTPGSAEPLTLFADPLGAPTKAGFPLRLRVYDPREAQRGSAKRAAVTRAKGAPTTTPGALRARLPTMVTMTERHTRDLSGDALAPEPEELLGRALASGKLRIERVIGAGGVGSVYLASHRELRMHVAVKVLHHRFQRDLDFCHRFHAEALAASRLDHPNLTRVLDFGQEPDGMLYLAMEYLDGQTLAHLVRGGAPLPLQRLVGIMTQVCAGLAHAHARGFVHRDVKPDNIMLVANHDDDERPEELVKVCDFGIALARADDENEATAVVGTPAYMSPEQCRGEVLDGRSDVYACGVTLYELATGRMPFSAASVLELLHRHMHVEAERPRAVAPGVDPRLEAIIMKALAKDPAERQQSMLDLRRSLRALSEDTKETFAPASIPAPPSSHVQLALGLRAREADAPDWLEPPGQRHGSGTGGPATDEVGRRVAAALTARPAAWLSTFAAVDRPDQLDPLARHLEAALPLLVAARNLKVLFAVRCTLDELADAGHHPTWRVARARTLLLAFVEPELLATLAEAALTSDRPTREASELLTRAGTSATYALYAARLKFKDLNGVRRRFVLLVREQGIRALPMIRAGLARLLQRRDLEVAVALALDLLEASPKVPDEAAGETAAQYLQGSPVTLVRAAAQALVWFWGARATPSLLGLLGCDHDAIRIAAIDGLRELDAIGDYAATRVASIARTTASAAVRDAARRALLEAVGNARGIAERTLAQLAHAAEPRAATAPATTATASVGERR